MLRFGRYLSMVGLLLVVCGLPLRSWAQEKRPVMVEVKKRPVMIEGKTFLPLRVLARPFSNIYKEPDTAKGTVEENVPTFQAYYVYTRPEVKATGTEITGWYEVGSDNRGTVLGWMRAEDVLEWKQNMSLAYTHPEGRKPVLMFETREALLDLIKAPSDSRKQRAEELYTALEAKKFPADFPVRSVEPATYIDLKTQFYLLPILEFGEVPLEQYEIRILKLAAAVLGGRDPRKQSTVKGNTDYLDQARSGNLDSTELLKKLEMDVVFVMDTTSSMQPFIDATLKTVKDIALGITQEAAIRQSIHFGLWCYRDSLENSGIEYLTKNLTPTLQPVEEFAQTLQGVHEAKVGSGGFDEDVFSGVNDAMTKTAWTPNALRFIVLVGDAPGHEMGQPWNYSKQSAETLRLFANDSAIYIAALHVKEPKPELQRWHVLAEKQFRVLTTNPGTQGEVYLPVNAQDVNSFAQAGRDLAGMLTRVIVEAKKGQVAMPVTATTPGAAEPSTAEKLGSRLGYAALVQWIGREKETEAPRDIIAWAVDRDLFDPALSAMQVRLLINKRELDDLRSVLQAVMAAGRKGQVGGGDFFTHLQTAIALLPRSEQSRTRQFQSMVELVPELLMGLPYKSDLMALTNDLWASWPPDRQDEFLKGVDAKISLYTAIHDAADKWIQLHQGDAPDEFVYPIALDELP